MRDGPKAGAVHHDVIIMGGGLAGLSLALQLKQRLPGLDILVLERNRHPLPAAAHKVGESTVEIGAHYFAEVLGLRPYLQQHQLKKFGFRFYFSDKRDELDRVTELGASTLLPTPSYQLDRGVFENDLGRLVAERGCRFVDQAVVRQVTLGEGGDAIHHVAYDRDGARQEVTSRWLIDASGRAALLKRKLGLAEESPHDAGADRGSLAPVLRLEQDAQLRMLLLQAREDLARSVGRRIVDRDDLEPAAVVGSDQPLEERLERRALVVDGNDDAQLRHRLQA